MFTCTRLVRPARMLMALTLLAGGLGLGGCVNQGNYDALYEANRALTARNNELMEEKRRLEAEIAALTGRINMGDAAVGMAGKTAEQLRAELLAAQARLADLERRLADLNIGGPLDAATDAALADLARRYPDILEYDAERGMIRFKSDVTFASGSYELTAQGKQTVRDLGRILLEVPSAGQYDIRVVGHTDGQRVTIRQNRPFTNNVELSAFRAISVRNDLVSAGLMPQKVEFAGWGENRPSVPNTANGNTPANRRVEVYLVRSTMGMGGRAASSAPAPAPAAAPASTPSSDIMK
ncbi:MAG: OmpA/MotB family protein [Phycisphaerales bacterium]